MPLTAGSRLGTYEITVPLGAGGMGEVFRARDTKLGRQVAIKVLSESVESAPDRVARFEREAKALAALHHPHIATLFGMEQEGGKHFLVMELVEGETLDARIARGPTPVPEALAIARQIADALEAAHEAGIVHRDLKPANVKSTPDGVVKVLDFGLAKALDTAPGSQRDISLSPTMTSVNATGSGTILGTAAYMSPEQARGMPTDNRSDIFAFGAVFYELLTGRQAFPGETVSDVLASVLAREPDWTALPAPMDPRLVRLLHRCVAKSRRQRWQAIGDVRAEIESLIADPQSGAPVAASVPTTATRPLWKRALAMAATAIVAGALAGAIVWILRPAAPAVPIVRFRMTVGESQSPAFTNFNRHILNISRDGSQIIYSGDKVYLRSMSETASRPVVGTDGFTTVSHPAFSPDGRSIVFWAQKDRTLRRLSLNGGAPVTLCQLSEGGLGLDWAGNAIFFSDSNVGIKRVPANGGQPELVVKLADREELYGPQLLPDGETLLFTLGTRGMPSWDEARIVVQSLRTGQRQTIAERATGGRYAASGHLLFGRGGVLYAVPFDAKRLAVAGEPVAVVEGIRHAAPTTTGAVHFAVSDTGTLVFIPGAVTASGGAMQLALFDRKGTADPLNVPLGPYSRPRLSPDGSQVAVVFDDGKESNIWIYGLSKTSAARRLTFGGRNKAAIWSADGQRVAFQSDREGDASIWWQRADGTDSAARLTRAEAGVSHVPQSWSRDGRHLLFDEVKGDRVAINDLNVAEGKSAVFVVASDVTSNAAFSPDGQWVAYTMRQKNSAQAVVFVEPYPRTGAQFQISKDAEDGHHPVWSADGHELFYTPGPGSRLIAVPISTRPSFAFGETVLIPRFFTNAPPTTDRTYDVGKDGRFLGLRTDVTEAGTPIASQIEVVTGWFAELQQRVPSR